MKRFLVLVSLLISAGLATPMLAQSATVTPASTSYSTAGGQMAFTVTLTYPSGAQAYGFSVTPPSASWTFVDTGGTNVPDVRPERGETIGTNGPSFGWSDKDITPNGISFTFVLQYPAGLTGNQSVNFNYHYRFSTNPESTLFPVTVSPVALTSTTTQTAPAFFTQPRNADVIALAPATFFAAATGAPTPSIKWQTATPNSPDAWSDLANGSGISGATTATLTIASTTLAMTGQRYRAVATNGVSPAANSTAATLIVSQAPIITGQPANQSVLAGTPATFSVTATGSGTLTYQWYFTPAGSTTPQAISGATSATYTISNPQTANAGDYVCIVTNGLGSATSNAAQLAIVPRLVRVVNPTGAPGANVVVPVQLVASGAENAVTFSLQFDPTKLTFVQHALGADASTFTPNTSQKDTGKVSYIIARSPGEAFAAGTRTLINLTFTVAASAADGSSIPLAFVESPTTKRIFSVEGPALPGAFLDGAVAVAAGFEGDVNGDGEVDGGDWVKLGRIVVGLDAAPTSGAAFMKTDCAPGTTKGNGEIDGGDWVQLGRYVVGLDLVPTAGGPTVPAP